MNCFYERHKDSIHWHYRCFDRILLNGLIQPFQQPERVVGFFNAYRQLYPVTRYTLRDIADQFQRWVTERAAKRNIPIVEASKGRRDEFVDPYFERAKVQLAETRARRLDGAHVHGELRCPSSTRSLERSSRHHEVRSSIPFGLTGVRNR
jgi:hypothetical protein